MVGIKDIAKAAGVSPSTVSNALNNRGNVSKKTKEEILRLCKELDYCPNFAGKALKTSKSNTVVLTLNSYDRNFYLKMLSGINDYLSAKGYDLIVTTHKSCAKFVHTGFSCGCIILDNELTTEWLASIASENYPIVVLDRFVEKPFIKSILVNNYRAMGELVQGVVDRGYKRYAFIGGVEDTEDNRERYQAFVDTLEANGLKFHQRNYFSGDYTEKSGYRAAKIFILKEELPQAFICANDNMAMGAVRALRENGYQVPGDVAVTGFDNNYMAELIDLTTVSIPNYERGYIAAQYLIENLRGKNDVAPFKINAKVIWRGTA